MWNAAGLSECLEPSTLYRNAQCRTSCPGIPLIRLLRIQSPDARTSSYFIFTSLGQLIRTKLLPASSTAKECRTKGTMRGAFIQKSSDTLSRSYRVLLILLKSCSISYLIQTHRSSGLPRAGRITTLLPGNELGTMENFEASNWP